MAESAKRVHQQVLISELAARTTCSIEEASVVLGIGRSTAYAAARDGSLPTVRLSKRLLVPTARLAAMLGLEEQEPAETTAPTSAGGPGE